ncbi:PH domain-containing protein [Arthrobacter sp. R-11]|uniref:PH domain-containing protein n=1 Tax=Arthrobacter sp. R-11 TaxID=3404053 RepID=UPI003CF20FCA
MAKFDKLIEQAQPHLNPGEVILAAVQGAYETKMLGKDTVRTGILMATGGRIVFFSKRLGGYDLESFEYRSVSSFEQSKSLMGHSIQFFASGNKVSVKWINDAASMEQFTATVREHLAATHAPTQPAPAANDDVYEQLRKLGELRDAGIVTPEEFEEKKATLIARI